MMEELLAAIDHFEREGARRFVRWDSALYRSFIEGPADVLLTGMTGGGQGNPADVTRVFEAYLRLVVEAIGCGYVDASSVNPTVDHPAPSLLVLLLVDRAPALLPRAPVASRVSILARAWNLAEGLFGEPAWLNRAVASALAGVDSLSDLDRRLLRVLEATAAPKTRAALAGPFSVRMLDTRTVDHAFLPGAMHFSAPSLVCLHDRRRKGVHAGLLLGPKGAGSLLGPGPCLGRPEKEDADLPTITFVPGGLRVGDAKLPLSFFQRGHSAAASRAGFLVASALDSQRLWIAESP